MIAEVRARLLHLLARRGAGDPAASGGRHPEAGHRHSTANLMPMWRSDLVGRTCPHTGANHGWWCPVCERIGTPCETEQVHDPKVLHTGKAIRWRVYMQSDYRLRFEVPGALDLPEATRFSAAMDTARRLAERRRDAAAAQAMGHVGWRVSTANGAPVVWFWRAVNERRGCSLVHIRPRADARCTVCSKAIEAGHSCWRGDGAPPGLIEMEGSAAVRVCVHCIATLTDEAWKDGEVATRKGRPAAVLRLVKVAQ